MQNALPIVRHPILLGLMLSIAIHIAVLYSRSIYVAPQPRMESGKTVLQLTLLPSISPAQSTPEPLPSIPPVEQKVQPIPVPSPVVAEQPLEQPVPAPVVDQDATMEEEKGVVTDAMPVGAFHPDYPRISRRRGEEGKVVLSVHVLSNGTVSNVTILQSSGYRRLDAAAMNGARQTIFDPALQFGRPVESTTQLTYTFRLTDD